MKKLNRRDLRSLISEVVSGNTSKNVIFEKANFTTTTQTPDDAFVVPISVVTPPKSGEYDDETSAIYEGSISFNSLDQDAPTATGLTVNGIPAYLHDFIIKLPSDLLERINKAVPAAVSSSEVYEIEDPLFCGGNKSNYTVTFQVNMDEPFQIYQLVPEYGESKPSAGGHRVDYIRNGSYQDLATKYNYSEPLFDAIKRESGLQLKIVTLAKSGVIRIKATEEAYIEGP